MKKLSLYASLSLLLLTVAFAVPAQAGTLYAPLVVNLTVDGNRFTTQIRATNSSNETLTLSYLYIDALADGTTIERGTQSVSVSLSPHSTKVLEDLAPGGSVGFLEVTTDEAVAVTSRLVGTSTTGERLEAEIPMVSSSTLVPGGETAILQGWRKDAQSATDFYMLNLSHTSNVCTVAVHKKGGALVTTQSRVVPALGLWPFEDVLGLLGFAAKDEVRARITCDQAFHAYAVITDRATAGLTYVSPSGFGSSTLAPPSQGGGQQPSVACPNDAWFEKAGSFHRPKVTSQVRSFELPLVSGIYKKLTVDVDFTPSDWANPSNGNHNIFWLHRYTKWAGNVFGYVNLFGPGKNFAKMSSNADLPPQNMWAYTKNGNFSQGVRYHVKYIFNGNNRSMEAVFTSDTGTNQEQVIARVTGAAPTNKINANGGNFAIYFGHPTGLDGPEVPTYDWLYSNLCVQIE
jgi:hypothetical protein